MLTLNRSLSVPLVLLTTLLNLSFLPPLDAAVGSKPDHIAEFRLASYKPMPGWQERTSLGFPVYLDPSTAITPLGIVSATAKELTDLIPPGDVLIVQITLDANSTAQLATLAANHQNEQLALLIDAKLIAVARIVTPITSGRFTLNYGTSYAQAKELADLLQAYGAKPAT
jgi:preprotein translocase subunit SecD